MTYIYQTATESMFHDAFVRTGRKDQFSYEGRAALYGYPADLADGTGEPVELDVIALCCDFTEYESVEEYNVAHETTYYGWMDVEGLAAQIDEYSRGSAIVHNL